MQYCHHQVRSQHTDAEFCFAVIHISGGQTDPSPSCFTFCGTGMSSILSVKAIASHL
jgi:hypothetical protein